MATHSHAAAIGNGNNGSNNNGMTTTTAILIVTLYLVAACYVWRDIKDLFWLNATANLFMLSAIIMAIVAGLIRLHDGPSSAATTTASSSS
jgi:uncharacterized ion transporter superfamily protein YfcC